MSMLLCAWRRKAMCGSALLRCRKEQGAVWAVPTRAMRSRLRPHVEGKIGGYDRGTGFGVVEYNSRDGQRVLRRGVPGTIRGERVIFSERRAKKKQLRLGVLERVSDPSPHRVKAPCGVYGHCGGCSLMHIKYEEQLEIKNQFVEDAFGDAGVTFDAVERPPAIASPLVFNYRYRGALSVRAHEAGVLVGFRARDFKGRIVRMSECRQIHPKVARIMDPLKGLIGSLTIPDRIPVITFAIGTGYNAGGCSSSYDDGTPSDDVVTEGRVGEHCSGSHWQRPNAALVVRHMDKLSGDDVSKLAAFGDEYGFQMFLQPGGEDSVHPIEMSTNVSGVTERDSLLSYSIPDMGCSYHFHPMDFIQGNLDSNRILVSHAIEELNITSQDHVLELFAGLGNFSMPIAKRAGSLVTIELSEEMVERCRRNAELNRLNNVTSIAADLYSETRLDPGWRDQLKRCTALFVDPPRSGCRSALDQLLPIAPLLRRIVYVSCNAVSLAEDAKSLIGKYGWKLDRVTAVDMFPHTAHVESIAVFSRSKKVATAREGNS